MFTLAPLKSAMLGVEIFFLMTGLLVVYSYLRYRHKGVNFNLFYFYLHRYLRLVPALSAVVLLYASLLIHLNDGPLWKKASYDDRDACRNNWWSSLLPVNNYVESDIRDVCIGQTWYLCVDFQLYLLSPLLLIPLYRKPRLGLILVAVTYLAVFLNSAWSIHNEKIKVFRDISRSSNDFNVIYIKTHRRAGSFLMGMALGYLIFNIKQGYMTIKISKGALWTGWLFSTTLMITTLYTCNFFPIENYEYNPWKDTAYLTFNHQIFTLCVIWVIIACTLGYGGWLDHFLSWRGWIPLSRLTYCAYLSHIMIQKLISGGTRMSITFFWRDFWYLSLADILSSFLAAMLLYLTVEVPCSNIVDWLLIGNKKKELEEKKTSGFDCGTLPKKTHQNKIYP